MNGAGISAAEPGRERALVLGASLGLHAALFVAVVLAGHRSTLPEVLPPTVEVRFETASLEPGPAAVEAERPPVEALAATAAPEPAQTQVAVPLANTEPPNAAQRTDPVPAPVASADVSAPPLAPMPALGSAPVPLAMAAAELALPPPVPTLAPAVQAAPPRPLPSRPPRPVPVRVAPAPKTVQTPGDPPGESSQEVAFAQPRRAPGIAAPAAAPAVMHAAPVAISGPWQGALAAWIRGRTKYPADARRAGVEGGVLLRFTVLRDGAVLETQVVRTSGSSSLDQAAMDMLRAARVPPFPPEMAQPQVTVTVPVRYRLED